MKKIVLVFLLCYSFLLTAQNNFPFDIDVDKFIVDRFIDSTGREIVGIIVPGKPPDDFRMPIAEPTESSVILSDVPAYDWSFGCSATSGAMMAGYYDRIGYDNMYNGPTNGGVAPLDNSSWGGVWINGEYRKQCPISATRDGVDGRTIRGHVDDYWIEYGNSSDDPWITNGWTQHTWGECTGDYMGTNQSSYSNTDGSTRFYSYTDGTPLYNYIAPAGYKDGCFGLREFFESRGYVVNLNYSQYIYPYGTNTQGFTFSQYKQEIDAGRPVIIQVTGHSMLGYGYDDVGQIIYLRDTWDYLEHSMSWGGLYSSMTHYAVVVIEFAWVPDISVSSPNGGETWQQGTSHTITWTDNISENVKIELYKGASYNSAVSSSTSSDGSYSWTVPSAQTPGTDYRIKITSITNSNVYDYSDSYFTISASGPPVNQTVQNLTIVNGQTECYDATNTITVAGSGTTVDINSGGEATFIAGQKIIFDPGFNAYPGSYVNAYITTSSDYCSSLPPMIPLADLTLDVTDDDIDVFGDNSEIRIYPNPTKGEFVIDFLGKETTAEIYLRDLHGRLMEQEKCSKANKVNLDISSLPSGMYIILIKTESNYFNKKIIKTY